MVRSTKVSDGERGRPVRHRELIAALEAVGMRVCRGQKVAGGYLFFTVGTERNRVTWTGPRSGDGDVAFVTTSESNGGLGYPLRTTRLVLAYAVAELHGWEAHVVQTCEDLERYEAATS